MSGHDVSRDISASLLQNILQIGYLDYGITMDALMQLTKSKIGQFFEKSQTGSLFICKYSTNQMYIVDDKYAIDTLPVNQYAIFHRNQVLAIISLDNQDALDDLADDYQKRISDSICIGLVMGTLRESKYTFTISVCNALSNIVSQVITMFDNLIPKLRTDRRYIDQINSSLNDVIAIIYDVTDYLEIDAEKVKLEANVVSISSFTAEISAQYETIWQHKVYIDVEDAAQRTVTFDKRWVQQMLISILKKLVDIPNLQMRVYFPSRGVLTFTIFSPVPRVNQDIVKKVQSEKISVNSLDIFIVKRLCEIMKGRLEVEETGVSITISVGNAIS
jgi:hypothetical protein